MDYGEYITEKMAAARLRELREQSARRAVLDWARRPRRGLILHLGIVLTRLGRWLDRHRGPVRNAGVRVARVR